MQSDLQDRPEMLVREIMTTPVHCVDMDDSLATVKQLFGRVRCHHVVVLEKHRVFGVVSDRDILKCVSPFVGNRSLERSQDLNTLKRRVHQIMSRDIVSIGPEETVAAAADKLLYERVSCLPVVDEDNAPLGIVTVRDFVAWAAGSIHYARAKADGEENFDDILIVVGGNRCYTPDATIGSLIRRAETKYRRNHGSHLARPEPLSLLVPPTDETLVPPRESAPVR